MFKKLLVFVQEKIENVIRRKENVTNHTIEVMEPLRIYKPWFTSKVTSKFLWLLLPLASLLITWAKEDIVTVGPVPVI